MVKRRFEILLPAQFNDGPLVADSCPRCLPDSLREAEELFGAFTFRPEVVEGTWTAPDDRRFHDRLSALCIDVEDTPDHQAWVRHFKDHLLQRFDQLEIYVTSHLVDVI